MQPAGFCSPSAHGVQEFKDADQEASFRINHAIVLVSAVAVVDHLTWLVRASLLASVEH